MSTAMIDYIGVGILLVLCMAAVFLYGKNIYRLVGALKTKDYGLILLFRIVGIFVPVVGVIMGFV